MDGGCAMRAVESKPITSLDMDKGQGKHSFDARSWGINQAIYCERRKREDGRLPSSREAKWQAITAGVRPSRHGLVNRDRKVLCVRLRYRVCDLNCEIKRVHVCCSWFTRNHSCRRIDV
jgi:hypothetical protein